MEVMMNQKSVLISLIIFVFVVIPGYPGASRDYWPTRQWKVSTPEEQGIDSEKLIEFMESVKKEDRHVHSLLIVRNGYLVMEAYFNPYQKDLKHIVFSAAKSISSLLIGLAIKDGYIKNVNQPVLDFFPGYQDKIEHLDERKKSLTLFHLLTMTDGLEWKDWPYRVGMEGDFLKLLSAADGVKYFLDKPMRESPGQAYNYNSGASYLLAAIIKQVTGKSALDYAREKLFKPIGIEEASWGIYQKGINNGASELFLKPRDMARLGFMVLNKGYWEGKQILPAQWIEDSSKAYVKMDFIEYQYGYMWYIDKSLRFFNVSAQGLGGQNIYIVPDQDMVVVFTGGLVVNRDEEEIHYRYLRDFIFPAVKSSKALPANPGANQKLQRLLETSRNPRPKPVPPLPASANRVSGKTFRFDTNDTKNNPLGLETVSLFFDKKNQCRIRFTFPGKTAYVSIGFDGFYRTNPYSKRLKVLEIDVGLDDVYRTTMTPTEIGTMPYFARGAWQDDRTFAVYSLSAWSLPEKIVFTFEDANTVSISWPTIFYKLSLTGTGNDAEYPEVKL
jgi:CubicO group peptidase (beta-lactamase class C family)